MLFLLSFLLLGTVVSFAQTGPGGIGASSTNVLWLNGETLSGGPVTQWDDQSGNNNHATQSVPGQRPIGQLSSIGARNSIRFNGGSKYLEVPDNATLDFGIGNFTIAVVFSRNSDVNNDLYLLSKGAYDPGVAGYSFYGGDNIVNFNVGNGSVLEAASDTHNGTGLANASFVIGTVVRSGDLSIYNGNNAPTTQSLGAFSGNVDNNSALIIGKESGGLAKEWPGNIAEIIMFNHDLNEAQKIILENYLAAKYQLANVNDYFAHDATHGNEVAGIGRVDASNIHTTAKGTSLVTISSPDDMIDGEFLFWGHNNGDLNSSCGTPPPRVWRVDKTGDVGTVTMTFDVSGYTITDENQLSILISNNSGFSGYTVHTAGRVYDSGAKTVTFTGVNLTDDDYFTLSQIMDGILPTITGCPTDITVPANLATCDATVNWTAPNATDNCTLDSFASSHNPGDVFPVGTTTVVYKAIDRIGNVSTCSFNVIVEENINPVISNCPANITIAADAGVCTKNVTWTAPMATDNCGVPTLTSTHNPGDNFPLGTTTVTYTATDAAGNTAVCSFDVTVEDNEDPVITGCPSNITISADAGVCTKNVTWTVPTATDNCGVPTLTSTHNPGDNFPLGTTTVTYTATDAAGNTALCSFDVTVEDNEDPVITGCPLNITISADAGVCTKNVTWTVPAVTDNCGVPTLTSTHNPGDNFPVGTTTVTYTARDGAGNTTLCSFDVIVEDNEDPVITGCLSDVTVPADNGVCSMALNWIVPTVSDNCSGVTMIGSHSPGNSFPIGTTTVTYTATDGAGNTANCSFNITVEDREDPVISNIPSNITIAANPGVCTKNVTWTAPTAADNCGAPTLISTHNSGDNFSLGTTTVTYTATDTYGNTSMGSFDITVEDTEGPVVSGCPGNMTVAPDAGTCSKVVTWAEPIVTDNCSGSTLTSSHSSGDTFAMGITTVTYTATDAKGNTSICSFDVIVEDNEAPVITNCPVDISQTGSVVNWNIPSASDNCSTPTLTSTHNPGDSFPTGTTVVTYTAEDASGNTNTCSFTIEILIDSNGINNEPTGPNLNLVTNMDTPIDICLDVSDPDGDVLSFNIPAGTNGQITDIDIDNGCFNFVPGDGFIGTENLTVSVCDDGSPSLCIDIDIEIQVLDNREIRIIKVLTPDQDGINDVWVIKGIEKYPSNSVTVFNRWGTIVFEKNGYNNVNNFWNGKTNVKSINNSRSLPDGTYFYMINLGDGSEPLKGFIELMN
ncbi:HYR domain-containing protein [Fulvivirgaceae bacterium BMA10]|uniref:HYR domain-containing protein n=1 Tax=Splendidivirga corallicola TaxID=3051826 RepID=A0ABT8KW46_9BACT|nr:HYR domain-containing protein [Fulvivirgaceae bacterium BMA10]